MAKGNSNSSRERILAAAEAIILQNGFSNTSIDDIIRQSAITKGGFFYHFEGKKGLAKALIERYLEQDEVLFNDLFQKADDSSTDPLARLLIFLALFADTIKQLKETHPGCLVAGFTYESHQLDDEIRDLVKQGVVSWRKMILLRLKAIEEQYVASDAKSLDDLADMFTSVVEGGIILSRIYQDNNSLYQQVMMYRDYISMIYRSSACE